MNVQDIVALAKSGYTSQQISAMMALQAQPIAQPQSQPVTQPQAQPVPQPQEYKPFQPFQQAQPVTPTVAQPVQQTPNNDPIMAEIQKLTQAMQNQAIVNSNLPTPQSADDILAQIINPKEVTNGNQ